MDLGLTGKTAVVTASSQGLGRAIAGELMAEGANVTICARRAEPLEEARQAIGRQVGGKVLAVEADMTRPADIEKVVAWTVERFGGIDILVNNTGDAAVGRTLADTDETWANTYEVNLWSCIRTTRAALEHLKKSEGGSIVNVASVSGHSGLGGMADYNSAKAAMLSLTKTWAQDLAPDGIRVNAVNPALIHTPLWERIADESFVGQAGDTRDEVFENLSKQLLLVQRYGRPDEVSGVVAFLASRRASFVTGACWNVDGGFTKFLT